MRTYEDNFSGARIFPGKGKLYVRGDSKVFRFQNSKSESLFLQRKNPRRISWTVLYRKQHRKGVSEDVAKKRARRVKKADRGIEGVSVSQIKDLRSSAAHSKLRDERRTRDQKKAAADKEKREKARKNAAASRGPVVSKQSAKGAFQKVQATSR